MKRPVLTARQVMHPDPVTVALDCPLDVVVGLMNLYRIGCVIVVQGDRSLAGIFTERDLLLRVATAAAGWQNMPVSDWMTKDPHTIAADADWFDALDLMDRMRVRHLPVVADEQVIGVISSRLLVTRRAEYLNRMIDDRTRELRLVNDQLLSRDAELTVNLRAAGRLQKQLLLPRTPPDWPELRWGVHYAPLDYLGGDYYDIVQLGPDHLGILIADASGHSVAAGMVAIMSRIAFAEVSGGTTSPGVVLAAVNERLLNLADERFVTAFYGVLDRRSRVFTYANAGHPHPLWYSASAGTVRPLPAQGFLLGVMPGEVYREREVTLEPGDRLCFYTDGLVESRNEIGEAFGTDRLRVSMTNYGSLPADRLKEDMLICQREFAGGHPVNDDVTLVVCELRAEG